MSPNIKNNITRYSSDKVFYLMLTITLLFTLTSNINENWGEFLQYLVLILGTLMIGIPHGAIDNYIFYKRYSKLNLRVKLIFYINYIGLIIIAAAVWYFVPELFMLLFVLYSAYHFGQSNWYYLKFPEFDLKKIVHYLVWGLYILLFPVLVNYQDSEVIINYISGQENVLFNLMYIYRLEILLILALLNLLIIFVYYYINKIDYKMALKEILLLSTLTVLYLSAPLLLSFFTYWIFFHSYSSLVETSQYLNKSRSMSSIVLSWKKSLPLTSITLLGILIIYLIVGNFSENVLIAVFF